MFERLADLAAEHAQLEKDLADPAIHADPERARTLSRRYGALTPIVQAYAEWLQTSQDEATAANLHPKMPRSQWRRCSLPSTARARAAAECTARAARSERRQGRDP